MKFKYQTIQGQEINVNPNDLADFNFLKGQWDQCLQLFSFNLDKGNEERAMVFSK